MLLYCFTYIQDICPEGGTITEATKCDNYFYSWFQISVFFPVFSLLNIRMFCFESRFDFLFKVVLLCVYIIVRNIAS